MLSSFHRFPPGASAALLLALVVSVRAHGPFDHSARLLVQENQIELNLTLGAEAAALLLRDFPDALVPRGPSGTFPLPTTFAPRVGILRSDDSELSPRSVAVHAEPLESSVSLIYPLPQGRRLTFAPRYLEVSDRFGPATLEMTDENGNGLGAVLLSRSGKPAELTLPVNLIAEAAAPAPAAAAASPLPQVEVVQAPTPPERRRSSMLMAMAAAVGVLVLVILIAVLFLRSRNSRS